MKKVEAWIVLGLALLVACEAVAEELDPKKPAARVNGQEITIEQLQRECLARFGPGTLQQMIDLTLVEQAAKQRNVAVSDEEVAKRVIAKQLAVEAERPRTGLGFLEWTAARRIALRELVAIARMELLLEKMVSDKVTVTDDDVAKYYQNNRDKFRERERMLISHIAVEQPSEAERIRNEILSGKISFAEAARRYSIDPYGRDNGGIFGWIVRGNDPIQQAAFELKKDGDISPVVKGQKGYEIIRREAYQPERVVPFEEVQDKIREMLTQERTRRLAQQMLDELRRAANIERLIDFQALNKDIEPVVQAAERLTEQAQAQQKQENK
ncbi:MAG: peptidyl-prolyl cis-trans isomerase [Armatimonadetes bacterium]|nr:peptidyl-prolyl cis-trans isomerase [Armatimonadota bacterium]